MGIITAREYDYVTTPLSVSKNNRSWKQVIGNWLLMQSRLRNHWDSKGLASAGHRIPYRVWSRHGAYLEMQGKLTTKSSRI